MNTDQQCTTCGSFKELEKFSRKKDGMHGRASRCKECAAEKQGLYRVSPQGSSVEQRYVSNHLHEKLDRLTRWQQDHIGQTRTPLARLLHKRRQARLRRNQAVCSVIRTRWDHEIQELSRQIQILRQQAREDRDAQVHGIRQEQQDGIFPGTISKQYRAVDDESTDQD